MRRGQLQKLLRLVGTVSLSHRHRGRPNSRIVEGRDAVQGHRRARGLRRSTGRQAERDGTEAGPERPQHDAGRLHRVELGVDGGPAWPVVVLASVELFPVDPRPSHAVHVEVDGDDESQRHVERTDRREHRVAKVLTDNRDP